MSAFDDLLDIGCAFDWITPTIAFIRDILDGGGDIADFGIVANQGIDRADIKRILERSGVKVWGLMYNTDNTILMFTTKKQQANFAYYLLKKAGVPLAYVPACCEANNAK